VSLGPIIGKCGKNKLRGIADAMAFVSLLLKKKKDNDKTTFISAMNLVSVAQS
jgi:hypothetical protein